MRLISDGGLYYFISYVSGRRVSPGFRYRKEAYIWKSKLPEGTVITCPPKKTRGTK